MQTKNAGLEHVLTALRAQLQAIHAHERGTRAGRDPEDLHETRVAVRRLRAILRAGRAMFERKWTESLRDELQWLGTALGRVRDLDVLLASLQSRVRGLPAIERRVGAIPPAVRPPEFPVVAREVTGNPEYKNRSTPLLQAVSDP